MTPTEKPGSHDDLVSISEGTLEAWRDEIAAFEGRLWPVFESFGYSKDTAYICFQLNRVCNDIHHLEDVLEDLRQDGK